ncbi:hypothetical protein FBU30_001964 [Linnemannia zychae]|nr:hypothetical protein FBU30_001964 [Linnemannia zychae]
MTVNDQLDRLKGQILSQPENMLYIEPLAYDVSLGVTPSDSDLGLKAQDPLAKSLMGMTQEFLSGTDQVLLVMGDSGSGKSVFLHQLERELWERYTDINDPIPILVNLRLFSSIGYGLMNRILMSKNFSDIQIQYLKSKRFFLICDGYDEVQIRENIYNLNMFNKPGQWIVKLILASRNDPVDYDINGRFGPANEDRYVQSKEINFLRKVSLAQFNDQQIKEYVTKFISSQRISVQRHVSTLERDAILNLSGNITWTFDQYMDALANIPHLLDLVRDPYLLSLTLVQLPVIAGTQRDISKISFDVLYKCIFDNWVAIQKRHVYSNTMSMEEQKAILELNTNEIVKFSLQYMKDLALEIFTKQGGNPMVHYSHLSDVKENPWKTKFFGPNPQTKLIRDFSLLTRSGNCYRFIHSSLLQYLYSLSVFDLDNSCENNVSTEGLEINDTLTDMCEEVGKKCKDETEKDLGEEGNGERVEDGDMILESEQAEKVAMRIQALPRDHLLGVINISSLSMTVQFLADRVQKSQSFKKQLIETVRDSRNINTTDDQIMPANAMTILVRSGMLFNNADLRGIKIRGANLTGGEFESADFRDSDLTNVTFNKAWKNQARFDKAKMSGVNFGEILIKLSDEPYNVALSPCESLFAVNHRSGAVTFYETENWKPTPLPQCNFDEITSLAFSSEGKSLLCGYADGKICLYDCNTHKIIRARKDHESRISSIAFSKSGCYFATAGFDSSIKIWDWSSFEIIHTLTGHVGKISSVAYSPEGEWLVSGGVDSTIRLWNMKTKENTRTINCGKSAISKVLFAPKGTHVASLSFGDNAVRIWSIENESLELSLHEHTDAVTGIDFSPNGEHIISSSNSGAIKIYDTRNGILRCSHNGHSDYVTGVMFTRDGNQFISCSKDRTIQVWNLQSAIERAAIVNSVNRPSSGKYPYSSISHPVLQDLQWEPQSLEQSPSEDISDLILSRDGIWAASISGGTINLWRRGSSSFDCVLSSFTGEINMITFSPDAQYIASVSCDNIIQVWRVRSVDVLWTENNQNGIISSILYSPSGQHIVCSDRSGNVRVLDATLGGVVHTFSIEDGQEIVCMAFSPCGRMIAAGDDFGEVRIWNAINYSDEPIFAMGCHDDAVTTIAFSPSGTHIASAGNGELKIWKTGTMELDLKLSVGNKFVSRLVYSPSGVFIASGISDGVVSIWDANTGTKYATFQDAEGVYDPVFYSDDPSLWTRSLDFKIRAWVFVTD